MHVRWSLLVLLLALVAAGCASSRAADTRTRMHQVVELRALERPTVRWVKLTFIALTRHRDARAAEELERASDASHTVLEWVDHHRAFARANSASLDCLEESVGEFRERAEEFTPALRGGTLKADERRELQRALAESANCIQASD